MFISINFRPNLIACFNRFCFSSPASAVEFSITSKQSSYQSLYLWIGASPERETRCQHLRILYESRFSNEISSMASPPFYMVELRKLLDGCGPNTIHVAVHVDDDDHGDAFCVTLPTIASIG